MKRVYIGLMEIYKTFSRLWYPQVSTVTPNFFFQLQIIGLKLLQFTNPREKRCGITIVKKRVFFKHRNVIETLIFIGSTTPPQHHFKKYFWRKKLLCAEINFIFWLYNPLFVLINRFISFHSYIQLCLTRTSANPNNAKNIKRISMHKKYIEGNKINLKYCLKALYHKKEI